MHCNLSFVIFVDMSANSEEICPQSEMIFTGILKNTGLILYLYNKSKLLSKIFFENYLLPIILIKSKIIQCS